MTVPRTGATRQDVERLVRAADRLLDRVGHWQPARWSTAGSPVRAGIPTGEPAAPDAPTRADVAHELVQCLADLAAAAERVPVRPVPRPENPLVLPDQVRVMLHDLLAADPPDELLDAAVDAVTRAEAAL